MLMSSLVVYGQNDSLLKDYELDFAIPDYPAFKALEFEPSNLLRPSSTQNFSISSSEFFNGGNLVIPKSFAIEIAPIRLMRYNSMTLEEYRNNYQWKTSRFSLGAVRDSLDVTKLAIGYRITLIDKGDFIRSTGINELATLHLRKTQLSSQMDWYLLMNGITMSDFYAYSESIQEKLKIEYEKVLFDTLTDIDKDINDFSKNYKEENWNAQKLDIAFALTAYSHDSLVKNLKYNSVSTWITYACPLFQKGKRVASQNMIGLYYNNYLIDARGYSRLSLTDRIYFGTNRTKFYLEIQGQMDEYKKESTILYNSGIEFNIRGGVWIDVNFGFTDNLNSKAEIPKACFKIRYTIPTGN